MFVSSYNKANVDCVFRQHWLFQPPWDEYISLRFASGNISSLGAYIINVALNPSQYLYNILYWQDHWPWIYISMKLCLTWNPQKFGCPQIIKPRTVFQTYRVYITNIYTRTFESDWEAASEQSTIWQNVQCLWH